MSIVGIDYGTRRVGIAVSESGELATPHSVLRGGEVEEVASRIAALASRLEATLLVLGIPQRNRPDAALQKYHDLAELLRQKAALEVVLWNEAYTTAEAASMRRETGRNWRKYKDEIDKAAAAVLLQSYLDARNREATAD